MKILFVLSFYQPYIGGIERVFKALAEGLAIRGHDVHVLTSQLPGTPAREIIQGVTVERVPVPARGDRYFFTFLAYPPAKRLAGTFDIVHTTSYNGAPAAFLAARLAHRPIVFTAHEVLGKRWHMVVSNPAMALSVRFFEWITTKLPYDRLVTVSQSTLKDALHFGVPLERAQYIYNGVDDEFRRDSFRPYTLHERIGADRHEFLYVYFGRPGKTKGIHYLIQAAAEVQKAIPHSRLVLILANDPRPWHDELVRLAKHTPAKIDILPPFPKRHDLFEALASASCVVVPSLTEGFGLTTAESCALGIPVVATTAGSLPEVISGRHLLVPPGSSRALADGIIRAARGQMDFTPLKTFSWDTMVEEYIKVYEELLK
jgi:glycosyltransferase involved in cell wall biosynthesis